MYANVQSPEKATTAARTGEHVSGSPHRRHHRFSSPALGMRRTLCLLLLLVSQTPSVSSRHNPVRPVRRRHRVIRVCFDSLGRLEIARVVDLPQLHEDHTVDHEQKS